MADNQASVASQENAYYYVRGVIGDYWFPQATLKLVHSLKFSRLSLQEAKQNNDSVIVPCARLVSLLLRNP